MRYLITGATGFLGRELAVRLLGTRAPIMVLMRRRGDSDDLAAARRRLEAVVAKTADGVPTDHAVVAFGDVTAAELGLRAEALAWLQSDEGPVQIVHGAAQVRFDLPYEEMHRQNVGGTENVLAVARALADRDRLARLDYVSTAFVAGNRSGVAKEDEIDVGQMPRNHYERSKLEAETVLDAAHEGGLPVTVHRPSIIVGDSRTGRASSFKVLYWPMKIYARGRWRTIFGRRDCTVDIVPVDFVADAMMSILSHEAAVGRTVHLAAGPEGQATIGELVQMAETCFEGKRVRYVDPEVYHLYMRPFVRPILRLLRPDVAHGGALFLPYLTRNPTFAVDVANELLERDGITPPRVQDYFGTIMDYARASDFGAGPPGGG